MKVTIDRFEGDYAIVELDDKRTVDMLKILIPEEAKEGDIIEIKINIEDTKERKKNMKILMEELWED